VVLLPNGGTPVLEGRPIMRPATSVRWTSWAALTLFAIFVALPGSSRSPFSGIPFSSKAHAVVAFVLALGICLALFPPTRPVRRRWLIALVVMALLKAALGAALIDEGWQGRYWTAGIVDKPSPHRTRMRPVRFFRRGIQSYRIDRAIDFDGINFALYYVNDFPRSMLKISDDFANPLRVHWTGYVNAPAPTALNMAVTANGMATMTVDGIETFRGASPRSVPVRRFLTAGNHRIDITYDKPIDVTPAISVAPWPFPTTPFPTGAAAAARSRLAAWAIALLGLLALVVLLAALADAYRRVSRFLLEDIWREPDKVALIALVSLVLLVGVRQAVLVRATTMPLAVGDDPRAYEGIARIALFDGPLMVTDRGAAFFFYPLYSYSLAAAHMLFGEDYGTIRFFNWLCIASSLVLVWAVLRKWLSAGSLVVTLFVFGYFTEAYVSPYAHASFTDNLFLPLSVAVVLAAANAFEKQSFAWLMITGLLTALGAAARPSLMLHAPIFFLTLLLFWGRRASGRALAAGVFAVGFAAGLAPFTIRNWLVAKKFVLLVMSGNIMLPLCLYPPDISREMINRGSTTIEGSIRLALLIVRQHPVYTIGVELRKVLFTAGFTWVGPDVFAYPRLLILTPIIFGVAVWARCIPRPALIAISSFALSHLAAMVFAAPWTYGYKTILPFHFMLAAGAAFLLPQRGRVAVREAAIQRQRSPGRKSVSVILPTYNEKDSIRQVILEFFSTGVVDEIVVVNNNAAEGTSEQIAGTGAREVFEPQQGYGAAIRRGIREATGDCVVICEPDGTFLARDIVKLLAYADDFDVVYGSRTSQLLVWRGANMGLFLRIGNWAVAKYLQFLFNAPSLSDVGCTMRLLHRHVVEELTNEFEVDGSPFSAEMIVLTLRHNYRVVQIPVNYTERVGASSVTGEPGTAFILGLEMIWLITRHRLRNIIENREDTRVIPPPLLSGAELRRPLR
jgi:hypothetical protein